MLPFGLDTAIPAGFILAQALVCNPTPPPKIVFNFTNNPPTYSNEKSSRQLAQIRGGSTSPDYGSEFPIVGGLTSSDYHIEYRMDFSNIGYADGGQVCVHPKVVYVDLEYTPVVYVANEYVPNSCRYNMTEEHERLHVNVDVITLNEYIPKMKYALQRMVQSWKPIGPIGENRMESAQNKYLNQISEALGKMTDDMQAVRSARQRAVDSREEYRRLSSSCQDEPDPINP